MSEKQEITPPLRVLVVGEDREILSWLSNAAKELKANWRIRETSPLRLQSPDHKPDNQDVLIILWDRPGTVSGADGTTGTVPLTRSLEGVLCELESVSQETRLRRTVILGKMITREDATFCAELGIRLVFPLPVKTSQWDKAAPDFVTRVRKIHEQELLFQERPEERAVGRFLSVLGSWNRLTDETKMKLSENLLSTLGDSSRYAELMARRSMRENDPKGAERWLQRAIQKNPNYLRALQVLADLYMQEKRYKEALIILERLKANNPRNLQRLTKIARCYLVMNELLKAEKTLNDAVAIDEFYQPAKDELGKVKCLMGDWDGARKLLEHSNNSKQLAAFFNSVGIRLVASQKFEESIEHYKKAQFVLPGNDDSHRLFFNIGLAYAKWGKLEEARKYLKLALARQPDYERAVVLLKQVDSANKDAA